MNTVKRELIGGVAYTALAKYSNIIVTLLVTSVLARFLSPASFGTVAITTVVINFFNMVCDMGIGPAIVQNKSLNKRTLCDISTILVYVGFALSIVFFILANQIGAFYKNEELTNLFMLLAICPLFYTANIVPNGLLYREKCFKFIAIRSVCVQILSGIFAIIAATVGCGVYSLIIPPIFSSIILFLINYKKVDISINLLNFKFSSLREIMSYSLYQFLFSFINYFSRNLDKIVVGKVLNMEVLGYYEKSYRLMMLPVANLSNVITPTIQPIFSEYQFDKIWQFKRTLKILHFLSIIGFPLSVLLYFTSSEIILIVFGVKWVGAIEVFRILSLSVGFQVMFSPQGGFFQASNGVKYMFYSGLITSFLNLLAVVISVVWLKSIILLAWLVVVTYIIAFFVTYFVLIKFVFKNSIISFLKLLISPFCMSVILSVVMCFSCSFIKEENMFISFVIKGLIFALLYFFLLLMSGNYKIFKSLFL